MPDERQTVWLVFAAARDSMQLFVSALSNAYLAMTPRSAGGYFKEHSQGVDASWVRASFPHSGTYLFTASLEADGPTPYELRVAPVISTGATRPTGASATLTLGNDTSTHFAVSPASLASQLGASTFEQFSVRAGRYRVLLVRDTNYVACRAPCTDRRPFILRPGTVATVAP